MNDLIVEVEERRQALRLSQAEVSKALSVSQGQYSKVVSGKVALTPKMAARIGGWMSARESEFSDLDQQIHEKCIELMHLLQRRSDLTSGKAQEMR